MAIRWNASLFLADILSLNAGRSLIQNNGFDGSGTNCGGGGLYNSTLWLKPLPVEKLSPIEENESAREAFVRYYHRSNCFMAKAIPENKTYTERRFRSMKIYYYHTRPIQEALEEWKNHLHPRATSYTGSRISRSMAITPILHRYRRFSSRATVLAL